MSESESSHEPQGRVPRWLAPRWAVIGIFLLLLVAGIAAARAFLMPVLLAFLLTLVFTPSRRALNRIGLPSWACGLLVIIGLTFGTGLAVSLLAQPVADWVARAPQIGNEIESKLRSLRGSVEQITEAGQQIDELTTNEPEPGTEVVKLKGVGFSEQIAVTLPLVVTQGVFVLVLLFFLIASGDMFYEKIVHVMPTLTDKRKALRIAFDVERALSHYFSTITLINALLGLSIAGAMWILNMPTPLLFGASAFLLNFIPYVGPLVGIIGTVLIGLISLPQPWLAFLAGGAYFALNSLEGQFVTPYFVGRVLALNTVVVFITIAFWAWTWSVVGMIVAVPTLVVMRVLCEHIDGLHTFGDFLSGRGAEAHAVPSAPRGAPVAGEDEGG